ncbi:hypothetical protein A7M79_00560 [Acinetobacter baumannii]|uniref:hypothetical protein n=1 Tax=Acinetobacter baumannii TaxID=470 RepID=UPI0008DD528B|nr:hypothetical protein [Acinetobacter baumannii]OIH12016.1 hypothetical protein A7M79_00560 [Acinetobacter baumannii]
MWELDKWLEATFGMSAVIDGYPNPIYMLLLGVPCFLLLLLLLFLMGWFPQKAKKTNLNKDE